MADLDRLEVAKVVTRAFYDLIPDEAQIGQIRQAGYAAADAVLTMLSMQRQVDQSRADVDRLQVSVIRSGERLEILRQISDMERTIGWESGEVQLVLDRVKAIVRGGLVG